MSEVNNEKGALSPKRERTPPGQGQPRPEMTEEQRQQAADEIINSAPLRSTDESSTNAPAEQPKTRRASNKPKPWRVGFAGNSLEQLMQMPVKSTISQTKELELRMAFIVNEMNLSRGLGPRVFVRDLQVQALDEFTTRKLKEMGYDVD